jgi:hemerythrin-like domain-containing protein
MPRSEAQWVFDQHEQARAWWHAIDVAWRRIQSGDGDDSWYAIGDFCRATQAFVFLFKAHAVRENNQTYPLAGSFFTDSDDALVMNLITHFGPSDITPFIGMVDRMEALLDSRNPL